MRWLRAHQVLLVLYIGGLTLALLELNSSRFTPDYLTRPESLLEPDTNIADVSSALYPERAYSLYYRALQSSLCAGPEGQTPPACRDRDPIEPNEIRRLIEHSLATGNRSIEMAMYNYAMVLLQEGADPEVVDAAIEQWRLSYPKSKERNPRERFAEMVGNNRARR